MAKENIKAIIFDMGGVLLRTSDPIPREAIAERFGVTRVELETFIFMSETSLQSEVGQLSDVDHWQTVMRHFNQPIEDTILLYDEYFSGDAIDQELLSFAASLKPAFKLGLLSNAWESARPLLAERFEFIGTFDESIFSYEIGVRKPDPAMYTIMLERLGVSPGQALFIDDMQVNVAGARAVGMQSLRFTETEETISAVKALLEI